MSKVPTADGERVLNVDVLDLELGRRMLPHQVEGPRGACQT